MNHLCVHVCARTVGTANRRNKQTDSLTWLTKPNVDFNSIMIASSVAFEFFPHFDMKFQTYAQSTIAV